MIEDLLKETKERMSKAVTVLQNDLMTIRTGRASPSLVERLPVEYYGAPTPLNQLATISAPEPRLLTIRPWDASSLSVIEKAILKSDLGLTPNNDGKIIRLRIKDIRVIGRNTVGAIQSGLVNGYLGLVEGLIARIRAEVDEADFAQRRLAPAPWRPT